MKQRDTRSQEWYEGFVTTWQQAGTVKEVAKKYQMTNKYVSLLATVIRKKGVKLKNFRAKIDYKKLNALVSA